MLALLASLMLAPTAVRAGCTVYGSGIAFGTYLPGSPAHITGTITADCTDGIAYSVGLSAGMTGGGVTNRKMVSGTATLNYALFQDSVHSLNWGQTAGTDTVADTGTGGARTIDIYAQLPAGQYPQPGLYIDTIVATVFGADTGNPVGAFLVTTVVTPGCVISATDLAFGTYTGLQTDSSSTLSVTCTKNTDFNVGLSAGTASGATVTQRRMSGPGSGQMNYALYRNSARTLNWGETTFVDTMPGRGTGGKVSMTVYGRISARAPVAAGAYTDTITATITY